MNIGIKKFEFYEVRSPYVSSFGRIVKINDVTKSIIRYEYIDNGYKDELSRNYFFNIFVFSKKYNSKLWRTLNGC